jgi:hypothetical protein
MACFETFFRHSGGKPIEYDGRTLQLFDEFPTLDACRFRFEFLECNAIWRQGVHLLLDGQILVDHRRLKGDILFWFDSSPQSFEFEVTMPQSHFKVCNVWQLPNGGIHSCHNGAAMICEEIENGRRYRCNDGKPDDDFDDIIFTIERIP